MENNSDDKKSLPIVMSAVGLIIIVGVLYFAFNSSETKTITRPDARSSAGVVVTNDDKAADTMIVEKEVVVEDTMEKDSIDSGAMENDTIATAYQGQVIAGTKAPFLVYTQEDYKKAIASDKLVVLYFYATWCPVCQKEIEKNTTPAFNELDTDKVVAFRVNYRDDDVDDSEKELAREFGVGYQHTKVFLKNGERVLKSPESWTKERYLEEIGKALAN